MFTAALFTAAKIWKQPKSVSGWMDTNTNKWTLPTNKGSGEDGIYTQNIIQPRERIPVICKNMEEPWAHYVEISQTKTLYGLMLKSKKRQTYKNQ